MPKLVLDASVVICWCEELRDTIIFDKLTGTGSTHYIPQRVLEEVESDNQVADHVVENSDIVRCNGDRHRELSNRYFRLGSGEIAVLAVGEEFHENGDRYYCVLDDARARETCENLGLNLRGTIGLFSELISEGELTFEHADELIQEMKDNGTRLPENHRELLDGTY